VSSLPDHEWRQFARDDRTPGWPLPPKTLVPLRRTAQPAVPLRRGLSRLGPLGRLVIKAVEAALYVVLLDKGGVRAPVDIEG
jgi:hypothetical protein